MKTLGKYNADYDKMLEDHKRRIRNLEMKRHYRAKPAGVMCSMCNLRGHKVEMVYNTQGIWNPRYYWENHWRNPVRCPRCGYKSYKKDIHSGGTF